MPDPANRSGALPADSRAEEDRLVRRSQKGDEAAFEQLVRRYQNRVFSIIANVLHSHQEVEDLAQQVFMKLYFALPAFRFRSALSTFIYRVAVNECYDYLRRRRAREAVDAALPSEEQTDRLQRLEEEQAVPGLREDEKLELKEAVTRLLAQATAEERILLTLRELEGFSIREIGEMTDMNENTVKVKLYRARTRLARLVRGPKQR